jgi:6-phosphofructokinase 1
MLKKKIAMLTGGGDAPGLNAVIYALTRTAILKYGYEVIGYKFGYRGLYKNDFIELNINSTSGILHKGGTILYSSNKDNLFDYIVEENGIIVKKDVSDVAVANLKKENVDALVVLGGDGTLTSARDFARKGINVIGIPKTIDNDLNSTDITFGFDTAVSIVTENLGRLHTTAESHHRVIIVEVMGRNTGWIAMHAGISGSADVILIPEIPYSIDSIIKKIKERNDIGKNFTIIVVTEGAVEKGGSPVIGRIVDDSPDPVRFGGVAAKITNQLENIIDNEVRFVSLGHLQRGGDASPSDRYLSVRYGVAAADLIANNKFGNMVCLKNKEISYISLETVIGSETVASTRRVDPNGEEVALAKSLGICLGV